ncbi:Regulatory protein RecX [Artemisia annua]|uniref:Regulatory protein RecX n=1 Tax=Artemisia annua TaxID=35608 RepID=A0A2U1NBS7_ARTAN|nr:Regulatory protein RecX [Artemisia annua]
MSIFAGKLVHVATLNLQSRLLINHCKPTRIIVRCCSNSREKSEDFPVRYVPKRASKLKNDSVLAPKEEKLQVNDEGKSRIGLFSDEKLVDSEYKSGNPRPKEKNIRKKNVRPEMGERDYEWRSAESKDYENHKMSQFTNDDLSNVEVLDDREESRIGLFSDEKLQEDVYKRDNLRSKEKNIRNLDVRAVELGERDNEWRYAESKVMEEVHEFDELEGPEEALELDELDAHNGKYEIKHLAVEPGKTKEEAEKIAIGLLAARAYTALELKKKLLGRKFSHDVANAVISDFQNRGFINDYLYAESFSRSRWSSSSWGPRRIKQALYKKGVNDSDAQKAIKSVLEDGESGDDQISRLGLSKASMDHLVTQASKQWLRSKDLPIEKQKSRIITWLQYRGFNWGIISFILKKLQSEHPP